MCNIALVTFLWQQYWSAWLIKICEHRKTCIFCFLSHVKPTKMSWNLLKIWSWNFTSCSWEPCYSVLHQCHFWDTVYFVIIIIVIICLLLQTCMHHIFYYNNNKIRQINNDTSQTNNQNLHGRACLSHWFICILFEFINEFTEEITVHDNDGLSKYMF